MKKIVAFLFAIIIVSNNCKNLQAQNHAGIDSVAVILVKSDTVQSNQQRKISVLLTNPFPVSGFQFDLLFHPSLIVKKDSVRLSPRKKDHLITTQVQSSGAIRILCYSPSSKNIMGISGEIVSIPITTGDSSGIFPISFLNVVAGDSTGKNVTVTSTNGFIYISPLTIVKTSAAQANEIFLKNYPNPFNSTTIISFFLQSPSKVNLEMYNCVGQKVCTIYEGVAEQGEHNVRLTENNLSTGIYFIKLTSGNNGVLKQSLLKVLYLK